jgi:hypothetical protein
MVSGYILPKAVVFQINAAKVIQVQRVGLQYLFFVVFGVFNLYTHTPHPHIYIYIYVIIYVAIYICVCKCMHIYIYTYILMLYVYT